MGIKNLFWTQSFRHLGQHRPRIRCFEVIGGVSRWSVFGPLFFPIITNDLRALFIDTLPLLSADDLKLLFTSCNFQEDFFFFNWILANGVLANHTKTMSLSFKGILTVASEIGTLEMSNSDKDFGLIINGNLKWVNHVNYKNFKARSSCHKLNSTVPWTTPSKNGLQFCQSMVLSALHGSAIWSHTLSCPIKIEKFQRSCLTWAFGKKYLCRHFQQTVFCRSHVVEFSMISFLSLCLRK